MTSQRGVTHLLLIIVLLVTAVVVILLISQGKIKIPSLSLQKKPSVAIKTEYKNPFNKETQFVNPFEKYKNPFVVNR